MSPELQIFIGVSITLITASSIYIAKSLGDLNVKIAVVIQRVDSHEERIVNLEEK